MNALLHHIQSTKAQVCVLPIQCAPNLVGLFVWFWSYREKLYSENCAHCWMLLPVPSG